MTQLTAAQLEPLLAGYELAVKAGNAAVLAVVNSELDQPSMPTRKRLRKLLQRESSADLSVVEWVQLAWLVWKIIKQLREART